MGFYIRRCEIVNKGWTLFRAIENFNLSKGRLEGSDNRMTESNILNNLLDLYRNDIDVHDMVKYMFHFMKKINGCYYHGLHRNAKEAVFVIAHMFMTDEENDKYGSISEMMETMIGNILFELFFDEKRMFHMSSIMRGGRKLEKGWTRTKEAIDIKVKEAESLIDKRAEDLIGDKLIEAGLFVDKKVVKAGKFIDKKARSFKASGTRRFNRKKPEVNDIDEGGN